LTLDTCIELALVHNPLWLASEQDFQASLARVAQAKAIPQPSLEFDSDLQPSLMNFRDSGESYLGGSWTLEFPGRRSLRGKIATLESGEVLADRDLLRLEIVYQVKEAFYSVLLAEERKKYAELDLELAQDFYEKAEAKFSAGDIAKVEVLRAGVEASKAATAVKLAESEALLAKAQLNFILGRRKFDVLEVEGDLKRAPLPIDTQGFIERALAGRPEMVKIMRQLEREGRKKKEASLSYLPDFDISLSRHRIDGETTTWDFTLSFPIPVFFWQPKKGQIAEAEANMLSLERQVQHLGNVISLEVEQASLSAKSAENQIVLFQGEILKQAEDVYDLILFSFQEGEIGGLELIEARRTLNEARRAYADALYTYSLTLAALERAVGGAFEGGVNE
jgi:cobalt-zinc-cadmium efflux system outer membrane protein